MVAHDKHRRPERVLVCFRLSRPADECRLRPAGHSVETGMTMIAMLWGAGALVVAVYMVAALLRPERF